MQAVNFQLRTVFLITAGNCIQIFDSPISASLLGKLLPFHFELSLGENKITMVTTAPSSEDIQIYVELFSNAAVSCL